MVGPVRLVTFPFSRMSFVVVTLTELVSLDAFREVHKHYRGAAVTQHIKEHLDQFKTRTFEIDADLCRPEYRLTIDEDIDIAFRGEVIPQD